MPKQKAFLKESRVKKKKDTPSLDTADDYQAAGVDFEEAAGKHRAGDAVKSLRFFQRALDVYDEGLRRFPPSFDLAYNKARVQYEVATHPKLVKQLQSPILTVLETALASHEYALNLDANDPDLLFNTSQVLTSIAEEIANKGQRPKEEALPLLEKALELQGRCLSIQEQKYEESQVLQRAVMEQSMAERPDETMDDAPPTPDGSESQDAPDESQWASIVEPVTVEILVDTVLAQIGTATTLCSLIASSHNEFQELDFSPTNDLSTKSMNKLNSFSVTDPEKQQEIWLAKANLKSVLLETRFLLCSLRYKVYRQELDDAFMGIQDSFPEALIAQATANISFCSAPDERQVRELSLIDINKCRWAALGGAMSSLTRASKAGTLSSEGLTKTHFLRGDVSMFQYRLSKAQFPPMSSKESAPQLLKNAEVYYRNVAKLTDDPEEMDVSKLRSQVAVKLGSDEALQSEDLGGLLDGGVPGRSQEWLLAQLDEMEAEGLLFDRTGPAGWH